MQLLPTRYRDKTSLILFFAVFVISWSSILIRWMGDIHPLVLSFYRLFLSTLILLPFAKYKNTGQVPVIKKHSALIIAAGLLLALHFYFWITSLQLTTVGRSIFLESTHPVFGVLLSLLFLKELAPKSFFPALGLGLAGMYLTVHNDIFNNQTALLGDGLAVLSAFCLAAYLLIARKIGNRIPMVNYLIYVYGTAALILFVVLLLLKIDFRHIPGTTWLLLILLTLGPNTVGHSLLNWSSRRMPIYRVNMALLSESVLATAMAFFFLSEKPELIFLLGAVLILMGIGWVFRGKDEPSTSSG